MKTNKERRTTSGVTTENMTGHFTKEAPPILVRRLQGIRHCRNFLSDFRVTKSNKERIQVLIVGLRNKRSSLISLTHVVSRSGMLLRTIGFRNTACFLIDQSGASVVVVVGTV